MALVEQLPVDGQIVDAPPVRLDLSSVVVPAEVELTFVAGMHDARLSNNRYLEDMLAASDVVVTELLGYDKGILKQIRAIAQGSYSDLQKKLASEQILEQTSASETDPGSQAGQAQWDAAFYRMLFGAKKRGATPLRVLSCDYPATHPDVWRGSYVRALRRFSMSLSEGNEPRTEDLETMARRDIYIGTKLCESIDTLRKTDPKLSDKSPLKVLMPYGGMHYAIVEALVSQADATGVDSLSAHVLFEIPENVDGAFSPAVFDSIVSANHQGQVAYQNWLRSAER